MAEMVICKSCGFITEKEKLGDQCPACGVPAKMFLPHDEHISPKRKMLLSLDIHPVMVHFPQAFTATIFLLSLAGLITQDPLRSILGTTIKTLGVLLPFTIALTFAAGIFDGKIRFRKVKTPLLIKKMLFGSAFFLLGSAVGASVIAAPIALMSHFILVAALSAAALGFSAVLGLIGTSLINARFPG